MVRLGDRINAELFLFGQYGVSDHRVDAERFVRLKSTAHFRSLFHESRTAVYCGSPDFTFHSDLSVRLALDNFELGFNFLRGRNLGEICGFPLVPKLKTISKGSNGVFDERMPEALWYIPVNDNNNTFPRVGLNLHYEYGEKVVSIANIQGAKKSSKDEDLPRRWPCVVVGKILTYLDPSVSIVRGISSGFHPSRNREGFDKHRASCLYDLTFRSCGMEPIRNFQGKVLFYELKR